MSTRNEAHGPRLPRLRAAANENAQVTQKNRHLALASDKAVSLLRAVRFFDGAEMAEQVAQDVVKFRKKRSAVIFHCEVEDLVDFERFTEEMLRKPKWRCNIKEKEGHCG